MARRPHTRLPSERASDTPNRPARPTAPLRDSSQLQSVRPATDAERARAALLAADHCLDTDNPTESTRQILDALGLCRGARAHRGV